jgi:hypothetical protein
MTEHDWERGQEYGDGFAGHITGTGSALWFCKRCGYFVLQFSMEPPKKSNGRISCEEMLMRKALT